jgi:aminoglycoside/choline kinase family phosphotransferase
MSSDFNKTALERLSEFLKKSNQSLEIEQLTPDASARDFFRVKWNSTTAIACIYPFLFDERLPQIDVTGLFLAADLPVAKILKVEYESGIVLHEDFGDTILRDVLENTNSNKKTLLIDNAIKLIVKIQKSTPKAFELNSIAGKLKFDEEKLLWELEFFKTHYFESLLNFELPAQTSTILAKEFIDLSQELEKFASVLTHRDYHTANLMLDKNENLKIIDHQDARIGSAAYDLVSLLLDRIISPPNYEWLTEKKNIFLQERDNLGLESLSFDSFNYEFELVTVQRCLKAIGTFSNQAANFGKSHFLQYIKPMFKVVIQSCQRLEKFPILQEVLSNELNTGNY